MGYQLPDVCFDKFTSTLTCIRLSAALCMLVLIKSTNTS